MTLLARLIRSCARQLGYLAADSAANPRPTTRAMLGYLALLSTSISRWYQPQQGLVELSNAPQSTAFTNRLKERTV